MITKRKLTYDILNTIRGGKQSDDENISHRQVGFWVDNTRALLIRRDYEKGRSVNPDLVQTICSEVIQVDAAECGCLTAGCTVYRTKEKIPNALEVHNKNLIMRVGPAVVGSTPFSFITYERAQFANNNKYTKHIIKAFYHNGYIYLIGENNKLKFLTHIAIDLVMENPEDAANFVNCTTGEACYTDDSKYPISAWMVEPLKEMIFNLNVKIAASSPTDNSGNAEHDVEPNIPKA